MKETVRRLRVHARKIWLWFGIQLVQWMYVIVVVTTKVLEHHHPATEVLKISIAESVTLTLLSLILLNGWIAVDELGKITRNKTAIEVFGSWHDAKIISAICSAQKSIKIVDSYFDEVPDLGDWVKQALDNGAKSLEVAIYVVSSKTPFGAQRDKERRRYKGGNDLNQYVTSLGIEVTHQEREDYEASLDLYIKAMKQHDCVHDPRVTLSIWRYAAMPSVRLIIIDDDTFLFGWFPLRAHNPPYICFSLHDHALSAADREVISRLKDQFENVRAISTEVE